MKNLLLVLFSTILISCGGSNESKSWYKPDVNTSWQWQLSGNINTSYDVELYDIDLFDTPQSVIDELHNQGKKVICYFSAGSYENWRDDNVTFVNSIKGYNLDGWAGEKWLDISQLDKLKPIMDARFDLAVSKKCDGVEPDNIDGYDNNTSFALSANDQLIYNKYLAKAAHKRGLSIALKNDINQIVELEPFFDFAVNEQCNQYNECDKYSSFTSNNKAVLNSEYNLNYIQNNKCTFINTYNLRSLVLPLDLDDSFRISCD